MNKKDESVYLKHILDSIEKIEEYTKEVEEDKFARNTLIQDGVIRQLEIIGEAGRRISQDFRKRYKDIPWEDITGMRDKLIHGYFGVDLQTVWDTVKKDIPVLEREIKKILKEISQIKERG